MATKKGNEIVRRLKGFADSVSENPDEGIKKFTRRTIRLELDPKTLSADEVRKIRELLQASQAIFAQFLGVSTAAVQDWEQGRKPPSKTACRLMDAISNDPDYWKNIFQSLATPDDLVAN